MKRKLVFAAADNPQTPRIETAKVVFNMPKRYENPDSQGQPSLKILHFS